MSAAPLRHSKPAISTDIGATCALYRAVEFCLSGSITARSAISSGLSASSGGPSHQWDTVAPDSRPRIAARIHRRFETAVGGRHQTRDALQKSQRRVIRRGVGNRGAACVRAMC